MSARLNNLSNNNTVINLAKDARKHEGRLFVVGGAVRDSLVGLDTDNIDLEVYGLQPYKLLKVVEKYGKVEDIGKTFGILKLSGDSVEIDISLPRKESKVRPGHKGFDVDIDIQMPVEEALSRRDFTINSMAYDPLEKKLIDPFGGKKDLKKKILKITNADKFAEDSLRVLRAVQFAGRFQLKVEPKSVAVIKRLVKDVHELSKERIWEEWRKLFLKSEKPSFGLKAGEQVNIFKKLYPEFYKLKHTPQNPEWHPEGSVWNHTKIAVDKAAYLADKENLNENQKLTLCLSVFCHDLGKGKVTRKHKGVWRSFNHAQAGVKPAKNFLKKIGAPKEIKKQVEGLVLNHMQLLSLKIGDQELTDGFIRSLARELDKYKTSLYLLYLQTVADWTSAGPFPSPTRPGKRYWRKRFVPGEKAVKRAKQINAIYGSPDPAITGSNLLKKGFNPGKNIGTVIELAEKMRDKGLNKNQILAKIPKVSNTEEEKSVINKLKFLLNKTREE